MATNPAREALAAPQAPIAKSACTSEREEEDVCLAKRECVCVCVCDGELPAERVYVCVCV